MACVGVVGPILIDSSCHICKCTIADTVATLVLVAYVKGILTVIVILAKSHHNCRPRVTVIES